MLRASGTDASFRTSQPLPRKSPVRFITPLLTAVLLLAVLSPATAQGGLYGPEAPRDVSFVRLINARPGEAVTPAIAGVDWQPLDFAEVSNYRQLPPGEHLVNVGGFEVAVTTQPESFTTLVLLENELLSIADTPLRDISRGLLTLYNLTDGHTLSLHTADGTEVISGVAPLSAASRAISQAEVELVVVDGEEAVATLATRLYRRGEAHGVIVLPAGSDPRVTYAPAAAEH